MQLFVHVVHCTVRLVWHQELDHVHFNSGCICMLMCTAYPSPCLEVLLFVLASAVSGHKGIFLL
jgi:hypothetical protein